MELTKAELGFIQEFEAQRKNKNRNIVLKSIGFASLMTLVDLFDADFSFHFERLKTTETLFTFLALLIVWFGLSFIEDYFKSRKYKKLNLKREA